MEKTVEYYMSLPYTIIVYPEPDGDGYTAVIPDLPGCMTCGDSFQELGIMIEDAKRLWLETAVEKNFTIKEPEEE